MDSVSEVCRHSSLREEQVQNSCRGLTLVSSKYNRKPCGSHEGKKLEKGRK